MSAAGTPRSSLAFSIALLILSMTDSAQTHHQLRNQHVQRHVEEMSRRDGYEQRHGQRDPEEHVVAPSLARLGCNGDVGDRHQWAVSQYRTDRFEATHGAQK